MSRSGFPTIWSEFLTENKKEQGVRNLEVYEWIRKKNEENSSSSSSSSDDSNSSSSDEESESRPYKIQRVNIERPLCVSKMNILTSRSTKRRRIKMLNKIRKKNEENSSSSSSSSDDSNSSSSDEESESRPYKIKRVNIETSRSTKRRRIKMLNKIMENIEENNFTSSSSSDEESCKIKKVIIKKPTIVPKINIFMHVSANEENTRHSSSKEMSDCPPCKEMKKENEVKPKSAATICERGRIKKIVHRIEEPTGKRKTNEDNFGIYHERDSSNELSPTNISSQFKKTVDDTLTFSAVGNLYNDMKSVGVLVSNGNPIGTVFCAGAKYVVTALHVIKAIPETCLFKNMDTFINFNESPVSPTTVIFTLKKLAFHNQAFDIAVLEVSNKTCLPKGLALSKLSPYGINYVYVVGYGHHNHRKKTLDPCPLVNPYSSRIPVAQKWLQENVSYLRNVLKAVGRNPDIADYGLGKLNDSNFVIDSYMEHGVSGAPAIGTDKYGRTKVVGVMTHGTPELYDLLPAVVKPKFPCEHRFAIGTTMESVYDLISKKKPELASALFWKVKKI